MQEQLSSSGTKYERSEIPLITKKLMKKQLLIIDDDPKAAHLMERFLNGEIYHCHTFQDPHKALEFFRQNKIDLVITDMLMPNLTGAEVLKRIRKINQAIPVIIITAFSNLDHAIEALRLGATDFVKKPFDMDELRLNIGKALDITSLKAENKLLKARLKQEDKYRLIGTSVAMQNIYALIDKIKNIRCSVIIEGESGTGKELAARAIHYQSQDADKPFVVIDCGALTDTLLQSELFGYEKGAFTGANQQKKGLLETASGGTIFLDEICNISDNMQTKLLRVVQEQQIIRVGGVKPINIDVRFVAATNQPMENMVKDGKFRHDLYHRLNVINLQMPPLREHREDLGLLIDHFIKRFAHKYERDVKGIAPASLERLNQYLWPGNIRELGNIIERCVALADDPIISLQDIPTGDKTTTIPTNTDCIDNDLPSLAELEKRYILKILAKNNNNKEKTSSILGINKTTLWRKLKEY